MSINQTLLEDLLWCVKTYQVEKNVSLDDVIETMDDAKRELLERVEMESETVS